jgi:hypothetical protein
VNEHASNRTGVEISKANSSPKRCVLKEKQDDVLDKDKTMDNVQKPNPQCGQGSKENEHVSNRTRVEISKANSSPKRCVLKEKQDDVLDKDKTMDNVQKPNIYTKIGLFLPTDAANRRSLARSGRTFCILSVIACCLHTLAGTFVASSLALRAGLPLNMLLPSMFGVRVLLCLCRNKCLRTQFFQPPLINNINIPK